MKYFKVTFGRWINTEEPVFDGQQESLSEWLKGKECFYVGRRTIEAARDYARTFEGIETHAYEGLGNLEDIMEITEREAKEYLTDLSVYAHYRPQETDHHRTIL